MILVLILGINIGFIIGACWKVGIANNKEAYLEESGYYG